MAVAVEGRPAEVFTAAGSCPYERPAATEPENDLARCVRAPLWFVFDLERPPAARVGDRVTARADREVHRIVDGATLSLARLDGSADAVPTDLAEAIPIGTIAVDAGAAP